MSVFNSFGKPMLALSIILLVAGIIGGITVSNYNPWQNAADARKIDQETSYQSQVDALALQLHQRETEAQIESIDRQQIVQEVTLEQEIAKNQELRQLEIKHQKTLNAQEISEHERNMKLKTDVYSILSIAGSLSIIILTSASAYTIIAKQKSPKQLTTYYHDVIDAKKMPVQQIQNPWQDRAYQTKKRKAARQRELDYYKGEKKRKNILKQRPNSYWPTLNYPYVN